MINKYEHLKKMYDEGIIAVIRAESPSQALDITEAVRKGGINIIEITLTVPGAINVISKLYETYKNKEILLGAGTVLDSETARLAILEGAEFIVSPSFHPEVVKLCNRYQKVCMPGCMTVTEIVSALEAGADLIKFFPGSSFGPSVIKALKGPVPQAEFVPTGGVNMGNIQEWLNNGCFAVGVGGELTRGAAAGDYAAVIDTAARFVEKIRAVRSPA